jgi:hypothetical protein
MNETKAQQGTFEYKHSSGDIFTYNNTTHVYTLNGIELPGTTTPLKLVNELSWDESGKMTDKSQIIQAWALKKMQEELCGTDELNEDGTPNIGTLDEYIIQQDKLNLPISLQMVYDLVKKAKGAPMRKFKDAGISGTEIHEMIETLIIESILTSNGIFSKIMLNDYKETPQVCNFINWAIEHKVKFLFSEEPIYSKEWMNCGTVDFICEIDGKILIGDIKTNGDKRRYGGRMIKGKWVEDMSKPQSDIHIPALWQTGCYGKMATEEGARKLIDRFDGVVVVNIKKSGEFDKNLDVRYDYNVDSLIKAYEHVLGLYKAFRSKY